MSKPLHTIVKSINENQIEIIENISEESVEVYCWIQRNFHDRGIIGNYAFQYLFKNYYHLTQPLNALSEEWLQQYFELLDKFRNKKSFDFDEDFISLYMIPDKNDNHNIQFSAITKLIHTIDPNFPIYEGHIINIFGLSNTHGGDYYDRLIEYTHHLNIITKYYNQILKQHYLDPPIKLFKRAFHRSKLTDTKILDFIFDSADTL